MGMMFGRKPGAGNQATLVILILGMVTLLTTMGAMNGGTALAASVWDALRTTLTGMLSSTFTIALAMVVLIVAVWQITHGRGYGTVGLILGLLSVALIGPGFVTTLSTSTREPMVRIVNVDHAAATDAGPERARH